MKKGTKDPDLNDFSSSSDHWKKNRAKVCVRPDNREDFLLLFYQTLQEDVAFFVHITIGNERK